MKTFIHFAVFILISHLALSIQAQGANLAEEQRAKSLRIPITADTTYDELMSPFITRFDFAAINGFIDVLSQRSLFPSLPRPEEKAQIFPVMQLNPNTVQVFAQIEQVLFGRTGVFKIHIGATSMAQAYLQDQVVAISSYLDKADLTEGPNGELMKKFILAHELGHYVASLYTRYFSAEELTISRIPEWRTIAVPPEWDASAMSVDEMNHEVIAHTGTKACAHAEIDAIAAVVLRRMGLSDPDIEKAQIVGLNLDEEMNYRGINRQGELVTYITGRTHLGERIEFDDGTLDLQGSSLRQFEPLIRARALKTSF